MRIDKNNLEEIKCKGQIAFIFACVIIDETFIGI